MRPVVGSIALRVRDSDQMSPIIYFVNVPDGALFVDPYGPMLMTTP